MQGLKAFSVTLENVPPAIVDPAVSNISQNYHCLD